MVNVKFFKKALSNPLVHLLSILIVITICHSKFSPGMVRFFLTISVCLRELLIFVLPFLLFSFVAVALSAIPKEGMFFVLGLMLVVMMSNFLNILISGAVGFSILSAAEAYAMPEANVPIVPIFALHLPQVAETIHALFAGVIVGFINSLYPNKYVSFILRSMHYIVLQFMKKFFVPMLPVFVGGFLLKLFSEGRMAGFLERNTGICLEMCGFLWIYLTLWLLLAASFKTIRAKEIFRNAFPAIVTAFSTMSSAAALPLSLEAAEKNTKDKVLADAVMPLTLNFHMVGDTIVVPIMAMIVLLAFNHPLPGILDFVMFGVFFVLNKFAGGGVPSGTIMVTVPVLKEYMGFDDTMIAFIIAFYGIMDPIATSGNVAANNFFVIIFQKMRNFMKKRFFYMKEIVCD
ncbi:MAG: dicarboxylate/amino acid:cation symporter [Holosporaceae bacterium]|jgi:Na+/H+-dicarboxylate symporter|nr:dicarboxylate/amino acid:cation symporter [Holosporaceae bacterium]